MKFFQNNRTLIIILLLLVSLQAGAQRIDSTWMRVRQLVGLPMPAVNGITLTGKKIDSNYFKNQVVVLSFANLINVGSLKQIPYLNRIQNDFKGKPLRILSVIPNTKKDVADFNSPVETSEEGYRLRKTFKLPAMEYDVMPVCEGLRPDSIPIGVFCDTIVKDYLIGGYPTLCIIDQNRVVRYVHIGFAPKEKQQEWLELVERQIQTLLLPMATGESATLPNILFETNSYELTEPSKKELESVVTWLQENQNFKIEIRGYTDDRGTAEHNQVLSENRARSVYQYLQARGIETTRLAYRGLGESNAVAGNETEAGRKLNRRIEIALTGE